MRLTFDIHGIGARLEEALDDLAAARPGSSGRIARFYIEAKVMAPVLNHALMVLGDDEGVEELPERGAMGVALADKVEALEELMQGISDLPDEVVVSLEGREGRIEIGVEGGGRSSARTFPRAEAPWFARDMLRRAIPPGEKDRVGRVACPYCASKVRPRKGELWGVWCPKCEVLLVME